MGWAKTKQEKSCHYCGHLMSRDEKEYFCKKGGLDGEVFEPMGKGRLTLWQKLELYKRQGVDTKLSLRLEAAAADCKDYDDEP